jgi:hypothetical protein
MPTQPPARTVCHLSSFPMDTFYDLRMVLVLDPVVWGFFFSFRLLVLVLFQLGFCFCKTFESSIFFYFGIDTVRKFLGTIDINFSPFQWHSSLSSLRFSSWIRGFTTTIAGTIINLVITHWTNALMNTIHSFFWNQRGTRTFCFARLSQLVFFEGSLVHSCSMSCSCLCHDQLGQPQKYQYHQENLDNQE